jgi:hypothetical protein
MRNLAGLVQLSSAGADPKAGGAGSSGGGSGRGSGGGDGRGWLSWVVPADEGVESQQEQVGPGVKQWLRELFDL